MRNWLKILAKYGKELNCPVCKNIIDASIVSTKYNVMRQLHQNFNLGKKAHFLGNALSYIKGNLMNKNNLTNV